MENLNVQNILNRGGSNFIVKMLKNYSFCTLLNTKMVGENFKSIRWGRYSDILLSMPINFLTLSKI